MAYDEDLVNRIRELIAADADVTEKKMFGGLAFLIGGHNRAAARAVGQARRRVRAVAAAEALISRRR